MNIFKWIIVVVAMIAGFNYFQKQEQWKGFTSQEQGFSVMMPGTPNDLVKKQPTAVGNIEIHNFIRLKGKNIYGVSVNKFPIIVSPDRIDYVLGGVGADIEKLTQGKVWNETKITLGENPGRDLKVSNVDSGKLTPIASGKYDMNMRVYLAKGHLFQIMMLTPAGSPFPEKDGAAFFDSFSIL